MVEQTALRDSSLESSVCFGCFSMCTSRMGQTRFDFFPLEKVQIDKSVRPEKSRSNNRHAINCCTFPQQKKRVWSSSMLLKHFLCIQSQQRLRNLVCLPTLPVCLSVKALKSVECRIFKHPKNRISYLSPGSMLSPLIVFPVRMPNNNKMSNKIGGQKRAARSLCGGTSNGNRRNHFSGGFEAYQSSCILFDSASCV